MSKLTLEEKRLQQIRMQLFGKDRQTNVSSKKVTSANVTEIETVRNSVKSHTSQGANSIGEARFVKQDISKVIILSLIAVGGQFLLYYLSLQGIINLNALHLF